MNKTGFLRHIQACNQWEPGHFHRLWIDGSLVGRVKAPMLDALGQWPEWFQIEADGVHFARIAGDFVARSKYLAEVTGELVAQGVISHIHGEPYPVTASGRDQALATIDRAAAPYFGLRAYGQHMNGFVRTPDGLKLWIAKRSATKVNFPNKLDNMVAGGLPHELSLTENLLKECWEEAAIPASLAMQARPVGVLTYCKETAVGLKPDTLYCYDLELPVDFQPENTDGEVAEFLLLPILEVADMVHQTDDFKLNCNLVIIDFLVRHGLLKPEHTEYLDISTGLHERL